MDLTSHELESLRRSLAIGNGLPADQIHRLLETCTHLLEQSKTAGQRDDQVRAELDALRPIIAELRQRLTSLSRTVAPPH